MKKIAFLFLMAVMTLHLAPLYQTLHAADHAGTPAVEQAEGTAHNAEAAADTHHAPHIDGKNLSLLWTIPFIGILLSIAIFPLVAAHFWHHNYGKVSLFWGVTFFIAFTAGFGPDMSFFYLVEVYMLEFIPFIMLLLALFTVSGGIRLKGELIGSPVVNTIIIALGTFLASWMGTTGAAMLLIRPLLRANSWRTHNVHTVVFFIFLVANIGGSLTPLGDPPLFLGFLKGVDFFWTTTHLFPETLSMAGMLLTIFFIFDYVMYKKETAVPEKSPNGEKLSIDGKRNFFLIPCVVGAVLISSMDLGKAFTLHHVDMPLASLIQVILLLIITLVSMKITPTEVRAGNEFSWEPIKEVAKLFATIFITMVMPIAMLKAGTEGPLGIIISKVTQDGKPIDEMFFWATGILSSFLDNAPTYVVFFETAGGNAAQLMTEGASTLIAISCGAVFMGANTYIGNAPNFMVKSIAEEAGVKMPSFFGYLFKWSVPILFPLFLIMTYLFFL
jgi:Na+/H+ antiporter NhaD/arsenite permease-like protein